MTPPKTGSEHVYLNTTGRFYLYQMKDNPNVLMAQYLGDPPRFEKKPTDIIMMHEWRKWAQTTKTYLLPSSCGLYRKINDEYIVKLFIRGDFPMAITSTTLIGTSTRDKNSDSAPTRGTLIDLRSQNVQAIR